MAVREGSWWSRAWGALAVLAFAVHLGAAVYEAVVVAPLWSLAPPSSVSAWAAIASRPDSSTLFHPLVAVIFAASTMAWLSGVSGRGWRRWWLTLSLASACAVAVITVVLVVPCERALFGAAALSERDGAVVVALTGDWVRAAALRLAALLVGAWAAYRAQASSAPVLAAGEARQPAPGPRRRSREFAFGDEDDEEEVTLGDEAVQPRERWRASLPARRRTAKK